MPDGFSLEGATPVEAPATQAAPQPQGGAGGFDMDTEIEAAAKANNVPSHIFHGLVKQESNFDPYAVSSAGAAGLAQLMPDTATGLGVKDVFDPRQNLNGGAKYLRQMLDAFGGDTQAALAAYNAGPGHPERWTKTQLDYADAVMANASAYQQKHGEAGKPYVIGDSLANGIRTTGGFPGDAQDRIPPYEVWRRIQAHRKDVAGQDVVLSSGISNDPSQLAYVQRQIVALNAAGAKSVSLVGVGNRADLAPLNSTLAGIAQQTGARFMGPVAGSVHPDAGYGAMVQQAMPQQVQQAQQKQGGFSLEGAQPVPPSAFSLQGAQPNFPVDTRQLGARPHTNPGQPLTAGAALDAGKQRWPSQQPIAQMQQPVGDSVGQEVGLPGAVSPPSPAFEAIGKKIGDAFGTAPFGFSPEGAEVMRRYGIFGEGPLRQLNEMLLRGVAAAGDAVGRAGVAALQGGGEAAYRAAIGVGLPDALARDVAGYIEQGGGFVTGGPHAPIRESLQLGREQRAAGPPPEERAAESPTPTLTRMAQEAKAKEAAVGSLEPGAMQTLEALSVPAAAPAAAPAAPLVGEALAHQMPIMPLEEQGQLPEVTVTAKAPTPEERLPPEDLPPVPEGHTRVYHGGDNANSGGPRWVTPDYRYARDYRPGQSVWYADVPNNHPALEAATDREAVAGTDMKPPIHSFEAPSDITARLRPVDTAPTAPEEPFDPAEAPPQPELTAAQLHEPTEDQLREAAEPKPETAHLEAGEFGQPDPTIQPGRRGKPYETVPPAPMRLIPYLQRDTVLSQGTPHETVQPGGIKDEGGDLRAILGIGEKQKRKIINNETGRSWNDALIHAWEGGYLPEYGDQPPTDFRALQDAIRDDQSGTPRYSIHDQEAVDAYHNAIEQNREVDRLSGEYGIPTQGMTRDMFYDALHERMSLEDRKAQMAEWESDLLGAAHEVAGQPYPEQSQGRTLEDLEREYSEAGHPSAQEQRAPRPGEPGHPGTPEVSIQEGEGPGRPDTGDAGRGEAGKEAPADITGDTLKEPVSRETDDEWNARLEEWRRQQEGGKEVPDVDLAGSPLKEGEAKPRAEAEPTIRNDPNQNVMPGMEPSAVQAQAARDAQGRGALQTDVPQKKANEGLFAPDTSGQATLYSFPGMLFDPATWRPLLRAGYGATLKTIDAMRNGSENVRRAFFPMALGTTRSQAFVATAASDMRRVNFRFGEIDRELVRNFTPDERWMMGEKLDEQSAFEQDAAQMSPNVAAAARQAFVAQGGGLAGLNPRQRQALNELNVLSGHAWMEMQRRGMVEPRAQALPYYFPRQLLAWDPDTGFSMPNRTSGTGGGSNHGLVPLGTNFSTAGPMRREHRYARQTEAAGRLATGQNVAILNDIRMLPQRLAQVHRAMVARDLMDQIEQVGRQTGVNLVIRGGLPGMVTPGEYYTNADHPAFREWRGGGYQPIHIASEFEGPLKAVLTSPPGGLYRGIMAAKGVAMRAIMWSPFMHLNVEIGRALPVMLMQDPLGVPTMRWMRDGSTVRRDPAYMDQATHDGIVPLGHQGGWKTDPVSIADQANVAGRNAFVRAIASGRDRIANAFGQGVMHDIIQHPHQTLLWDQVFNLQMGIYDNLRRAWEPKYGPDVAGTMAAHIANRYAGALPSENLSRGANMASNLLLFSRSFTLGNLGVMKDMFRGAPSHTLARIEQLAGPGVAGSAKSALQRKAIAAFVMDMGMYVLAGNLLQVGLRGLYNYYEGNNESAIGDWWQQAKNALVASGTNKLDILGVLPQYGNEPGKQGRIRVPGLTGPEERATYARLPTGKVGEEFLGWPTHPADMITSKASVMARPILEDIIGHTAGGEDIYKPNPRTMGDMIDNAGRAVWHFAKGLGPTQTIQASKELWQEFVTGSDTHSNKLTSALKFMGAATGLATFSEGYPGGPPAGLMHAVKARQDSDIKDAMPGIRDKLRKGDEAGAIADMEKLGVTPGQMKYYLQQTEAPGPSRGAAKRFEMNATPEDKERLRLMGPGPKQALPAAP